MAEYPPFKKELMYINICNHYSFKEAGRTQIARHNLDVFEGGGPVKCWKYIFLNNVLFARFHFSRSPYFLREFIYFLKNAGGRSILSIAFLKNM